MIAPRTSIANRPHWITFEKPGAPVSDGEGGWTNGSAPLDPPGLFGRIQIATARDLEQFGAGTTISQQALVVSIPYHPQITTATIARHTDDAATPHVFNVTGVANPDFRNVDLVLLCVEVVP
jgi:head-tail adaptor